MLIPEHSETGGYFCGSKSAALSIAPPHTAPLAIAAFGMSAPLSAKRAAFYRDLQRESGVMLDAHALLIKHGCPQDVADQLFFIDPVLSPKPANVTAYLEDRRVMAAIGDGRVRDVLRREADGVAPTPQPAPPSDADVLRDSGALNVAALIPDEATPAGPVEIFDYVFSSVDTCGVALEHPFGAEVVLVELMGSTLGNAIAVAPIMIPKDTLTKVPVLRRGIGALIRRLGPGPVTVWVTESAGRSQLLRNTAWFGAFVADAKAAIAAAAARGVSTPSSSGSGSTSPVRLVTAPVAASAASAAAAARLAEQRHDEVRNGLDRIDNSMRSISQGAGNLATHQDMVDVVEELKKLRIEVEQLRAARAGFSRVGGSVNSMGVGKVA